MLFKHQNSPSSNNDEERKESGVVTTRTHITVKYIMLRSACQEDEYQVLCIKHDIKENFIGGDAKTCW